MAVQVAGFKGVLQVDGYNAYLKLAEHGEVELAFRWVYVRRNFYELAMAGPAPIASEALKHIAAFYAIEKEIRGRSAEEHRLVRQQKSRPPADIFEVWLRAKLALINQKIKLAEAIRYGPSRWQGSTRFIDDDRIELDNNTVVRSIHGISDGGAEHWAVIAFLVETCKKRRSARLSHRRSDEDRQRGIQTATSASYCLWLPRSIPQSRGLKRTLTTLRLWSGPYLFGHSKKAALAANHPGASGPPNLKDHLTYLIY